MSGSLNVDHPIDQFEPIFLRDPQILWEPVDLEAGTPLPKEAMPPLVESCSFPCRENGYLLSHLAEKALGT